MKRFFFQILAAFIPLCLFSAWVIFFVRPLFDANKEMKALGWVGIGLAVVVLLEGLLLKFWLLPSWARSMSMRFYAGSYLPEDDPIASLASLIREKNRVDLIPQLDHLVEKDPTRARAWLDLASVHEWVEHDLPAAAEALLRGAKVVGNDQDAAMLLWRAACVMRKTDSSRQEADAICTELIERFPDTSYGKLAAGQTH